MNSLKDPWGSVKRSNILLLQSKDKREKNGTGKISQIIAIISPQFKKILEFKKT